LHKVAAQVQATIDVPLSHIADAVGREVQQAGITCVGVLGTRFVMEQDFYTSLRAGWHFSLPPTMPEGPIHEIIYKKSYPWET
jgi:aspartate racemase